MQEKDLLEKFRDYLYANYPNKKELVSLLADILRIEKEPAARRLGGKVQFTVREVGIISSKLNISIDNFLTAPKDESIYLSVNLQMPLSVDSIDSLIDNINNGFKEKIYKMADQLQVGYIFDSLPVEFFAPYHNLSKFMYFKWVYHSTKNALEIDYAKWELPQQINVFHEDVMKCWSSFKSIFYIWGSPVIWNLVKEVNLFRKMNLIKEEDIFLIKEDLHNMLNNIERHINNTESRGESMRVFDLYISSVNIGVSCIYYHSEKHSFVDYKAPFVWSGPLEDNRSFDRIYKWINSMKKISTLVSGSGGIERRIFFDEQHQIIDKRI